MVADNPASMGHSFREFVMPCLFHDRLPRPMRRAFSSLGGAVTLALRGAAYYAGYYSEFAPRLVVPARVPWHSGRVPSGDFSPISHTKIELRREPAQGDSILQLWDLPRTFQMVFPRIMTERRRFPRGRGLFISLSAADAALPSWTSRIASRMADSQTADPVSAPSGCAL